MGPRPHAEKGSLRSHHAAVHHRQFRPVTIWGPPRDQILDPPLILSPCMCAFVSVTVQAVTFECHDIETSPLTSHFAWWPILTMSRSHLSTKVIESRSKISITRRVVGLRLKGILVLVSYCKFYTIEHVLPIHRCSYQI